jgi:hypothetical protein
MSRGLEKRNVPDLKKEFKGLLGRQRHRCLDIVSFALKRAEDLDNDVFVVYVCQGGTKSWKLVDYIFIGYDMVFRVRGRNEVGKELIILRIGLVLLALLFSSAIVKAENVSSDPKSRNYADDFQTYMALEKF